METHAGLKSEVFLCAHMLSQSGMPTGAGGIASIFLKCRREIAITPSGKDYTPMELEDICTFNFSGTRDEDPYKLSIESGLFPDIFKTCPI